MILQQMIAFKQILALFCKKAIASEENIH